VPGLASAARHAHSCYCETTVWPTPGRQTLHPTCQQGNPLIRQTACKRSLPDRLLICKFVRHTRFALLVRQRPAAPRQGAFWSRTLRGDPFPWCTRRTALQRVSSRRDDACRDRPHQDEIGAKKLEAAPCLRLLVDGPKCIKIPIIVGPKGTRRVGAANWCTAFIAGVSYSAAW
jgi:hypothetical protein